MRINRVLTAAGSVAPSRVATVRKSIELAAGSKAD
jgi:hypothetical protein